MYNKKWYHELNRSPLSPPDWVFGVVWPILYALLVISFYLTFTNKKCIGFCEPLVFFIIQLAFNLSWTTIFFRLKMIKTALVVILVIIAFTIITFIKMIKISKVSAYLLIPYLLWLSFATYLNGYIVFNN